MYIYALLYDILQLFNTFYKYFASTKTKKTIRSKYTDYMFDIAKPKTSDKFTNHNTHWT